MESGMLMFTIVKDKKKEERQQARKKEEYIHCPSGVMSWMICILLNQKCSEWQYNPSVFNRASFPS